MPHKSKDYFLPVLPQAPEGSTHAESRQEIVPLQAENKARREQLNGATEDLRVKDQQLREVSEALKDAQAKNKQLQKTNEALAAQVKRHETAKLR